MPYCSIIIPTVSRAELLSRNLDHLRHQTDRDFEVIVVCDGEDAPTRSLATAYCSDYPLTWIFNPRNLGLAATRNIGAHRARGDILLFLDDDGAPVPEWAFHHCRHHRAAAPADDIVVIGQLQHAYATPPGSRTERLLRAARNRGPVEFENLFRRAAGEFGWFPCCGMNCSIRRDVFRASGGFDPAIAFAEDSDLGTRLTTRGVRMVYEPGALVHHWELRQISEGREEVARLIGRSNFYRARDKRQLTDQTLVLTTLHRAGYLRRQKQRVAWRYPSQTRAVAGLCRSVTERTGSQLSFRLWDRLISATAYWEGVRAQGATLDGLCDVVGRPLPVLLFHSISRPIGRDESRHHLSCPRFRRFMQWLRNAGYSSITPSGWLSASPGPRQVMLTFDDGYEDFYSVAYPALAECGFHAVVFVVVDQIGKSNVWDSALGGPPRRLLSAAQIRELHRLGVTIGSHSLTHAWLPDLSETELRREVADSKSRLEDLLGSEVACFAYPAGGFDARVRRAVARAGYQMGMTIRQGLSFWDDPLQIKRTEIRQMDRLFDFALKIRTGRSHREKFVEPLRRAAANGLRALPAPVSRAIAQSIQGKKA
jgi:peptidoglycan/xylan/chitin deacetylase (PgdA/CDA1 family)/GT2 family glycosyltransferase